MGKRVADQHAVMDRGWAVADELYNVLMWVHSQGPDELAANAPMQWRIEVALRRYEEARNG